MTSAIRAFRSSSGVRIYHIPLNLFPIFSGYVHLVFTNSMIALIDVSSGFGDGNDRIETGLAELRSEYGEITNW